MMDAHDEAAKALMPDCNCRPVSFYTCSKCDGTGEVRCYRDDITAALRKAAADEREACAVICSAMSVSETSYGQPVAARQLLWVAELIRARAKGGA